MQKRIHKAVQQTFLSLRNYNFRLFFFGQTISNTGNWLTNVALTLLVLRLTNSGIAIGILAACQYGPILLLSLWAGAIADRTNKRKLLLITQTLEMCESWALAILAFLPHPPIIAFYIVAIIGGILLAFDNPVRRSFVSEMVKKEDLPNAVVLNSTIVNVSRILGPAIAGILVVSVGFAWCFVLDALTYIAVLSSLWKMHENELRQRPARPRAKREIREGFRYIMRTPILWIQFIMLLIIGTLAYNFSVTLPLFVTKSLHGTNGDFTLIYSIFGCGALVSGLLVAHRGLAKISYAIVGAFALGTSMLLLSLSPSIMVTIPIIFIVGLSSIVYMNATTTVMQVEADPIFHGRVLALQSVLLIGTTPIGSPLLGLVADIAGARLPIVIGALACLAAGVFGYTANKRKITKHPGDIYFTDPVLSGLEGS